MKLTALVIVAILVAGCDVPTRPVTVKRHCTSAEDCDKTVYLKGVSIGGAGDWRCLSNRCVDASDFPDTW